MADFKPFAQRVHERFKYLQQQGELFVVDIDGDRLYDAYLGAFPEGTNPIFRTNTEHDCSCCKNFIRNIGNVVAIAEDGRIQTVWDTVDTGNEYQIVASHLARLVSRTKIVSIFRCTEPNYGAEVTPERGEDGVSIAYNWNHFFTGQIDKRFAVKDQAGAQRGAYASNVQVFQRGLVELQPSAIDAVNDLLDIKNGLYRGEEHRPIFTAFKNLQDQYCSMHPSEHNAFVWANAGKFGAIFRNTVLGTLVQDLSEGKPLEAAVKSFEDKMAGGNYKRPTALITPRMIEEAMQTVNELGLESALQRRFAKLTDVSVNNVLWVNGTAKAKMKEGLAGLLMDAVQPKKVDAKAEERAEAITIDEFMATIIPQAKGMEMYVRNRHLPNFVSLTAPVQDTVGRLFKWDNNFAWSYDGNTADSALRQQVAAKGGRVDGVLRFSHTWNYDLRNASLMDLHVFMPGSTAHADGNHDRYPDGQRVGWNERRDTISGGVQDVDYTDAAPQGYVPVENITFPDMSKLKEGNYVFKIHNWKLRSPTLGGFKAEIEFAGQMYEYEYKQPLKHKEWVTVAEATLKDGVFTIEHKIPTTTSTHDKWGIKTETFVPVDTLMFSPNYWDGNAVGNKHWFFMLNGCKNPEPTRGIYNEFLGSQLDKHRKVFEILGDKTKCPPADDQLSGLGFSSTRGDSVLVSVTTDKGNRYYNVHF